MSELYIAHEYIVSLLQKYNMDTQTINDANWSELTDAQPADWLYEYDVPGLPAVVTDGQPPRDFEILMEGLMETQPPNELQPFVPPTNEIVRGYADVLEEIRMAEQRCAPTGLIHVTESGIVVKGGKPKVCTLCCTFYCV